MTAAAREPDRVCPDARTAIILDRAEIDGAVFDLDGVITTTARLHERAWEEAFDAYLVDHLDPAPFTHHDYRRYVDGRPRADGVRTFLTSRGFAFDDVVVARIAETKNAIFLRYLDRDGAEVLPGARALLTALRTAGFRVGLFTASRNATHVLETAGLSHAFDAQVDGVVAARRGLAGKPEPDMPLACATELGVEPRRCALFEDAEVGIRAGLAGGFGRVVGVASGADAADLLVVGAHEVVETLAYVRLAPVDHSDTSPAA